MNMLDKFVHWYVSKADEDKYVPREELRDYLGKACRGEADRLNRLRDARETRTIARLKMEHQMELDLVSVEILRMQEQLRESEAFKIELEDLRLEVKKRARFNEKVTEDVARHLEKFKLDLNSTVGQVQGVRDRARTHVEIAYSKDKDREERKQLGQQTELED